MDFENQDKFNLKLEFNIKKSLNFGLKTKVCNKTLTLCNTNTAGQISHVSVLYQLSVFTENMRHGRGVKRMVNIFLAFFHGLRHLEILINVKRCKSGLWNW